MEIRRAAQADMEFLGAWDQHISYRELDKAVREGRVLAAEEQGQILGWLRWGLFWDSIPFMNMLYLLEENRGKGLGGQLAARWEKEMRASGYRRVLTSTVSHERAQRFYYRLGYKAVGGFLLEGEPYEIILAKNI